MSGAADQAATAVPAGWYPDGFGNLRYWDGARWTEHLVTAQVAAPPRPPTVDTTRRVVAYLIDMALLVPPWLVSLYGIVSLFRDVPAEGDNSMPPGMGWYLLGYALVLVVLVVNRGVVQGRTGKSLGKRVMKLRVVRLADGRPAGIGWGLLRVLLEMAAGIIDIVLGFVTEQRQRVGDMAAKTVVMNDEDAAAWFT